MKEEITQQQVYDLAIESFGVVPGIIKEVAERSLPVAYLYTQGNAVMENASFNAIEMNAIELKISSLNNCESCIKGHSFLLKRAGLSEEDIQSILHNNPTTNLRLNKLLKASEYIYYSGKEGYPNSVLDYFSENEISEKEIFEIIGLVALKIISNYTNNYLRSVKNKKQNSYLLNLYNNKTNLI